jgi:hypothetical protein
VLGSYSVISNLVIVPNRDPWKLLVAGKEIEVGTVCRKPPSVVVKSKDLAVWLRNATKRIAPPVISILVFIDVVAKMNDVINRILIII